MVDSDEHFVVLGSHAAYAAMIRRDIVNLLCLNHVRVIIASGSPSIGVDKEC